MNYAITFSTYVNATGKSTGRAGLLRTLVRLELAGIPVLVTGRYEPGFNIYYPERIEVETDALIADGLRPGRAYELEDFCDRLGYDYQDTYDELQRAVEGRDR